MKDNRVVVRIPSTDDIVRGTIGINDKEQINVLMILNDGQYDDSQEDRDQFRRGEIKSGRKPNLDFYDRVQS